MLESIRRLALAALDCGPSTLRNALDGDADARRILASQGVTPHDLTAITDARAARRRDCNQPRPQPDADPAHPPPPGADYPNFRCVPEPPRSVPVFGPWDGPGVLAHYEHDTRLQYGDQVPDTPIAIHAGTGGWWTCGTAPENATDGIDAARRAADRWAREQGWVLLDADPDCLLGSRITFRRSSMGQLCYLQRATTPSLRVRLYADTGWSVWHDGSSLAHGPQTGAEGERLLRVALDALGVEVLDG